MIAAIITAHDEATHVEHTVVALRHQTRPPERIVVMSDASTDGTVDVALHAGAEVLLTVDDCNCKAGALNQALATVLLGPDDLVLVLDADAELPAGFLARALTVLRDRNVGAVAARRTTGGGAALIRRRALDDVHHAFGRYCDEGPVTGQIRLALDLEAVGWRLSAPLDVDDEVTGLGVPAGSARAA
ncbi:glycosyltransferase [Kocuria sp. M1R5S2]|uniref:glycosyltransferase n=1 Tax=Kocuria rhizosphaerae TaxID=3376285 RepID=UPI0037AC9A36